MNLRERAHLALQQHRNSPSRQNSLSSEPTTPHDDEDELAILGGKTRLVPKQEKSASPQIPDRSPTTQNPIVPLPLSHTDDQAVHPYVLEYLRTFVPSQGAQVHSQAQAQAQAEAQMQAQVQAHQAAQAQAHMQMHTLNTPVTPSYDHLSHSANTSPISNHSNHFTSSAPYPYPQQGPSQPQQMPQFPQYFPVFDYGSVGPEAFAGISTENDLVGRSYSPESNMQSAWQEFVAQIGGNMQP